MTEHRWLLLPAGLDVEAVAAPGGVLRSEPTTGHRAAADQDIATEVPDPRNAPTR